VAERLARAKDLAVLYTSPLQRARQTAEIIATATKLRLVIEPGLREAGFSELAGLNLTVAFASLLPIRPLFSDHHDIARLCLWNDQQRAYFQRVTETLDKTVSAHPNERLVIVAHGGTIRTCLAYYLPDEMGRSWSYFVDHCSLTRILVGANNADLITFNDRQHLKGVP